MFKFVIKDVKKIKKIKLFLFLCLNNYLNLLLELEEKK